MIVLKLSEDEFAKLRVSLLGRDQDCEALYDMLGRNARTVDRAPLDVKHNDPTPQERL